MRISREGNSQQREQTCCSASRLPGIIPVDATRNGGSSGGSVNLDRRELVEEAAE